MDATGLKVFGQREWAAWKHGTRSTGPGWRKLHVGVDEEGFIVAVSLTDAHAAGADVIADARVLSAPNTSEFAEALGRASNRSGTNQFNAVGDPAIQPRRWHRPD